MDTVNNASQGFSLPLKKGPFQNNGASPWYVTLGLGTPYQKLKFSFDTGSNFIWVTSNLCADDSCKHYGKGRFFINKSASFVNIPLRPSVSNPTPHIVGFGPWGSMEVNAGNDDFNLLSIEQDDKIEVNSDLYTAKNYSGQQFEELDWDGGIGLPALEELPEVQHNPYLTRYRSSPRCAESHAPSFHFFKTLVKEKKVAQDSPFVTFSTDPNTGEGEVRFGKLDDRYSDSKDYLFLPWDKYSTDSLAYLWTTKMYSFSANGTNLLSSDEHNTAFLCLDSGSSQFKGDVAAMFAAYQITTLQGGDVEIEVGQDSNGKPGKLVITPEIYNRKIEAGSLKGEVVSQFAPLEGLGPMALVGSVLMDHLYTVYEYSISGHVEDDSLTISPKGMWIFNQPTGVEIIQGKQDKPAPIFNKSK
ncbi:pepsin-like aspartic protease [Marinomonas mediterranea]|uniref:pepsin-like aspartic protease n=1 Tax=Marinomonas mediterranea TaxID=119864 RepID=UPI00234BC835|nr:pepsin-like aspartic protease [Marinomonas mediterranea]WCN10916.1 peptidase A24 [Marinomonas mediterranea]WCN14978.1 peptidase A24 [Marinomonas mediterranea]